MTDANLMDADCAHGRPWYECDECTQPSLPKPAPHVQPPFTALPGDEFILASVFRRILTDEEWVDLKGPYPDDPAFRSVGILHLDITVELTQSELDAVVRNGQARWRRNLGDYVPL